MRGSSARRSTTCGVATWRRENESSCLVSATPAFGCAQDVVHLPGGIIDRSPLRQFGIAADDGEQVVEVVRDTPGQLTNSLHLQRLPELRLELLAFSQIACGGDDEPVTTGGDFRHQHEHDVDGGGAVSQGAASDIMLRLTGAQAFAQMGHRNTCLLDAEYLFDSAPDDFVTRHAVGNLGCRIDIGIDDTAIRRTALQRQPVR